MTTNYQGFTEDKEKEIESTIKPFKDFFDLIIMDPTLNTGDKYKVFGKFNKNKGILKVNPRVFVAPDFVDKKSGKRMSMLQYVLLHEIAHGLWKELDEDEVERWQSLSGWTMDPFHKPKYSNLIIPDDGVQKISNWYYLKEAESSFPRWYAKFSPEEQFCDCWAFVYKDLLGRMKGNIGARIINFINELG